MPIPLKITKDNATLTEVKMDYSYTWKHKANISSQVPYYFGFLMFMREKRDTLIQTILMKQKFRVTH